ncbi:MAG: hypothetical protein PHE56_11465 [Bacteroidales bacterium]|nr:hypothetical protein [Bacteroidales bacterium]
MKTSKIILAFLFVLFSSALSLAQTVESVMESSWKGGSQSRADAFDSGYCICTEKLYNIVYDDSDGSFTGVALTNFNLDGEEYVSRVNVSGTVNPETATVKINSGSVIYQDDLPYGMYWMSVSINLSIFEDEDHPGYYIMFGKTSNQYYDDEYYALSNYPY